MSTKANEAADSNAVVKAVAQVLANKRNVSASIDEQTRLSDLGLDSLDLAEILILIELDFGIEIDTSALRTLRHVKDLATVVRNSRLQQS